MKTMQSNSVYLQKRPNSNELGSHEYWLIYVLFSRCKKENG